MSKYIAIDLAPDGIYVVEGTARGGHAKIERALSWTDADGEAPPTLARDTASRIGEQLRDRLKAAGIPNAPLLVSIGRGRVILKELHYPAVPAAEEPALVKFQAMKELSDSADDVVLDYAPLANGGPEGERRSMAVVIRKELYAAIQQMCAAANLKLAAVTPRPYAMAAGLARAFDTGAVPPPESKADAVAALVLGPAGGEFTVARGGDVTFTRDVPGPVATSEPMLLGEVRRNLTMYAGTAPGHPVRGLYVAEAAGGWAGRLRAALGVPVHAYDPLNGGASEVAEPLRGRFAGAAGLLAAKAAGALPMNFAAPRQPVVTKDPKQKQLVFAALAALAVLAIGAGYGYLTLNAADSKLDNLRDEKARLEKEVKDLEPDAKRLDAATKWKARRVNWLDEMFDSTDRFRAAASHLRASDKFYAMSFDGHTLPPDNKTGKQVNQAKMDIKLAASVQSAADAFYQSFKSEPRFYTGAKISYGLAVQGDFRSKEYTIGVLGVKGRSPDQYTLSPEFTAPVRKYYLLPRTSPVRDEAGAPREKDAAEDEGDS